VSFLGKRVKLKGISQKGKNRVREQGETWSVFAETETVLFAAGKPGPWLFLAPVGKNQDDKASRWVKLSGDTDFIVMPE
jgi:hypothetical protein